MPVICTIAIVVLAAAPSFSGEGKIGPRLQEALSSAPESSTHLIWVYFADKGDVGLKKSAPVTSIVSERSLQRRAKVLRTDALIDETDLPVEEPYVARVQATGAAIQHHSKWFNAVSVRATREQIPALSVLSCVRELELIGRYRRSLPPPASAEDGSSAPPLPKTSGPHALDYGPSVNQVAQINVPALHDMGNSAQGVIVGVFDNGFRLPAHEAFASMDIIATYDFVDDKVSVVPNNTNTSFGTHGVNTLSTIGGYTPGQLIGPAYGASFILARTENDSSETPLEEDKWVRAIEWADSLGVQVTSTSLGYLDYNAGFASWTWDDMDGRTTVISRAAAMAVRKGIIVVNSAGNEGDNASHNTLGAPADADSVLSIGAVDLSGKRTSFSSVGPTTSTPPRIKPDVMALGTGVYIASSTQITGYSSAGQGTSFSCPLAAGVVALLVKAHPTATPMEIVDAMKATASQASAPDNRMGWGVVNALAADNRLSGTDTDESPLPAAMYNLLQNYPNPFNPGTTISYGLPVASSVTLTVYDMLGREIRTLMRGQLPRGSYRTDWDGTDGRGDHVASGVYVYRLSATGGDGIQTVMSKTMVLLR
jgi:subtilisin family serine protease